MSAMSWISGQPRERHASSATNTTPAATTALAAEIGFDDPRIGLDGARRSFGDLLAVIEDEHRLAESHDDLHVVLDEQHRLARVAQPRDSIEQVVEQRAVDAGGGPVERKSTRLNSSHRCIS